MSAGVSVGGAGVSVGGTGVFVGGTGVFVGGTGVSVGGTGVFVGGTDVFVGEGSGEFVLVGLEVGLEVELAIIIGVLVLVGDGLVGVKVFVGEGLVGVEVGGRDVCVGRTNTPFVRVGVGNPKTNQRVAVGEAGVNVGVNDSVGPVIGIESTNDSVDVA